MSALDLPVLALMGIAIGFALGLAASVLLDLVRALWRALSRKEISDRPGRPDTGSPQRRGVW